MGNNIYNYDLLLVINSEGVANEKKLLGMVMPEDDTQIYCRVILTWVAGL